MAVLFFDSFDHYATADMAEKWTAVEVASTGAASIGAFGRNSTNGFRADMGFQALAYAQAKITLVPSGVGFVVGFAFKTRAAPAVGATKAGICAITDVGAIQLLLRLNNDMTLSVLRGNTTVLGTTSASLSTGVSAFIEFKGTIDNSAGTASVYINGVLALSLTGIDSQATANTSWNGVLIGGQIGTDGASGAHDSENDFDDFYVFDQSGSSPWNNVVGDVRVARLKATTDGATTTLTTSTGTDHAALIDEEPPNDDTDYNHTSTTGNKDTYVMEDLPISGVQVYAVQVVVANKKVDPANASIAGVVRHSGTDYDSASQAQSTAYAFNRFMFQTNPGTSNPWTESDVNAMQAGVKKIA